MAVYIIKELGGRHRIKIGRSKNPGARLKELQTGNPEQLAILAIISAEDDRVESKLHKQFEAAAVRGEWFDSDPKSETGGELLEYIGRFGYLMWPPCPFCKGRSARVVRPQDFGEDYAVKCYNCDAFGPPAFSFGTALQQWMRSHPSADSA